jgi:oxygen-independent coproporphyrinogen-3 oxidase
VDYVMREADLVAAALTGSRRVDRMHWGGGTPTFLTEEDSARLVTHLRSLFEFDARGEYAIEIDPRRADAQRVAQLASIGFNRMSIGVQDFDPEVQRAVNRVQSLEQTRAVIEAGRRHGLRSINMDLIFGLPKQTPQGFARTLRQVIDCNPDRIALYAYAHLPQAFGPQARIQAVDLPAPATKLALMTDAIERLGRAGFVLIGMDHFARPDDELAVAQRQGRLVRDFQGYSSGGECELLGLGVSSIGKVGPTYCQNLKDLPGYYAAIDAGRLPVLRGIELTADDLARRDVINALACNFSVSKESIGIAHLLDFDRYFADELVALGHLAADGLVELEAGWIHVTPRGRLLVRAVCMVFDRHLRESQARAAYSRVM